MNSTRFRAGSERPLPLEGASLPVQQNLVIDLPALSSRCLGNSALVERVLRKFLETGHSDVALLEEAVEQSNFPAVVETAHRFKGASSNISASRLQELAVRVEELGRESNAVELTLLLPALRDEWRDFVQHCETFLSAANASSSRPTGQAR